ncbi:hypothetical protein X824_gp097 [Escherichia phage 4MG]|uniref:Hyphothetical protein n=1 Tax=Escherichia phage 4MG TaxID=1391428 RepID=V5KSS6_9CAUD|nr:hypothetical protein X824_gp097 [Escherichia phage 4MG]AGZ17726.1 hyphothetical protein [Escherichia phage 4MG]
MQITETLNDQQRLMSLGHKEALQQNFPIFNELTTDGYEVEFYYVDGFGGLTIVPSVKRIRVKANQEALSDVDYCSKLAHKVRQSFESRLTNPKFLSGQKISSAFKNKKGKYRV